MTGIPEIIAHRGAPREYLENTLRSFSRALELGADGIELDVHATRDGVVVVHHDPVIRVSGSDGVTYVAIADTTFKDLESLPLTDGTAIPTLDSVFDLVGDRATIYVEIKAPAIETVVIQCLDRHPTTSSAVHAFDHRIPVAIRHLRPSTSIGLLSTSYPVSLRGFIGEAHPAAFWQQAQLIDRALVEQAHALGARVIAWTSNDVRWSRQLAQWGVDALCTDTPGVLRSALTE